MKQLKITTLIWMLIKLLFARGNNIVFYHCCGGVKDCPMEIEGIEVRETLTGDKITIY